MKKQELLKLSLISTLVIGLFSLLFIEIQRFIMVASQKEEDIPHQLESVQLPPDTFVIPEGFEMPDIEITIQDGVIDSVDLTGEEAVELAMMYLWGIFGEDLESGSVEVLFEVLGPWWEIYVRKDDEILYRFDVDANTGELLFFVNSAYRMRLEELHGSVGLPGPLVPEDFLPMEEMEDFYELAKTFATARFNSTNVTHIELTNDSSFLWDMFDVVADQHLTFLASDAIGRQVSVTISRELQTLVDLRTIEPEFFPDADAFEPEFIDGRFEVSNWQLNSEFIASGESIEEALLGVSKRWPDLLEKGEINIIYEKSLSEEVKVILFQGAAETLSSAMVSFDSIFNNYAIISYVTQIDLEEGDVPFSYNFYIGDGVTVTLEAIVKGNWVYIYFAGELATKELLR